MQTERINFPEYSDGEKYSAQIGKIRELFFDRLKKGELFSFKLGDKKVYGELCADKDALNLKENELGDTEFSCDLRYGDLKITLCGVLFGGFPAFDYTVTVKNEGSSITEKISDLCAMDISFPIKPLDDKILLRTTKGTNVHFTDYDPVVRALRAISEPSEFGNLIDCSRSTRGGFPYFTVNGEDENYNLAVGWSGMWHSYFDYDGAVLTVRAKQRGLSTVLCPGESIRSVRVIMTYCNGGDNDSCKLWRRLFISRFLPNRKNGRKSFKPPISINFWGGLPQEKIINKLRLFQKAKVKPDLVWFDAGWNGSSPLKEDGNPLYPWYKELGDWQIHPVLFKDGSFKEVSSVIHEMGARFMLWGQIEEARGFVLDRLTFGRESYYSYENTMPNWSGDGIPTYTLRFSDDKVVDKLIDFFKMMHKENGMDCVRIDSFEEPYFAIRHNDFELSRKIDPENDRLREGYTENKHVTGLYRLWDSLYKELPDFFLDNTCAGGMRMDIELCSRGITLWRTDYSHGHDRESVQTHTQNLARWIPLQCVGALELKDEYAYRSLYSGVAGFGGTRPTEDDTDLIKKVYDEFDTLQPYWLGDYYQLIPARYDKKSWQAYELYREDMEEGAVIAVRRELSEEESRNIKLCGLEKDGVYEIRELLSEEPMMTKKGIELSEEGITLSLDQRKVAAYTVKRIK